MYRAKKLGLRGWVKNHPSDETVEGLAVGSSEQIQQLQVNATGI